MKKGIITGLALSLALIVLMPSYAKSAEKPLPQSTFTFKPVKKKDSFKSASPVDVYFSNPIFSSSVFYVTFYDQYSTPHYFATTLYSTYGLLGTLDPGVYQVEISFFTWWTPVSCRAGCSSDNPRHDTGYVTIIDVTIDSDCNIVSFDNI